MIRDVYLNNTLRERWDLGSRVVVFYDATGVQVSSRAFSATETAFFDAASSAETADANTAALRDKARQALTSNATAAEQLDTFAAGTASLTNTQRDSYLRQLAQYQARAFKQLNALIKLEVRDLTSTDGT